MAVVRTLVQKRNDPPRFDDRWPHGVEVVDDSPVDVILVEDGAGAGRPSVMICADTQGDGEGVVIETTWSALSAAYDSLAVAVVELGAPST